MSNYFVSEKTIVTYAMKVFEGDEFWGDATVYAEEAAVDEGSDWQCTEGLYACIVNSCRIFVETLKMSR